MKRLLFLSTLLCAAAALLSAQGTLTNSPVTLNFTWQSGSSLPTAKALSVKSGSSNAAYTAAISPGTALWLSVTPDSGKLPASMQVRVNPSGLAVGTYTATITVSATGFTDLDIAVSLAVMAPLPTLSVDQTELNFATPPNPPTDQTLTLNTTGGPISFTAAPQGATWMSISPSSGVVLPGLPMTVTVSVDASNVAPQAASYKGKVVITASGVPSTNKTQTVNVNLTANAPTPTITSLWPSAAQVGSGALTLTVRGTGFYKSITAAGISGNATPLKVTFVSPTILLVDLPASLLETAGTLNVIASNPDPGGDSAPSAFTVSANPVVQATVNAGSYSTGPISPGALVTLFGQGIGPETASSMSISGGFATTTLANVQVAIGSKNAAMIYVSHDQITVQAAYDTPTGTAQTVAVNNGGTIAQGTVDVTAVAPGIFTLDGSGTGQAAALTFSTAAGTYAVNSSSAPARAADVVILYLTGEGDYATSINPRTGYIVPGTLNPLPQLNPLPTVTIGGQDATVQYAGPMVGGILGLLQINAVVPDGTTKGSSVPVTVDIGGVTTQAGVTLVVK